MTRAEKKVVRAAVQLWNSRRAYLKHAPHGFDCEGEYWIIRNTMPIRIFRRACAALAERGRK